MTGTPVVAASLLTNGVIQPDGWDETSSGGQPGNNGSVSDASWIDQHEREIKTAVSALRRDWPTLQRWGLALVEVFAKGGRLLAAGNGGSAAEAQHLTAELVGRFLGERQPSVGDLSERRNIQPDGNRQRLRHRRDVRQAGAGTRPAG